MSRKHDHDVSCRYRDLSPSRAWRLHLRNMLIGWLVITVLLYLAIVTLGVVLV